MNDKPKNTSHVELDYSQNAPMPMGEFRPKMMPVPGFTPPAGKQGEFCPLPNCSQEDLNEYRSAGVLLKALAADARAWSASLPENYRPAILAFADPDAQNRR